jgi:hypothetical protein
MTRIEADLINAISAVNPICEKLILSDTWKHATRKTESIFAQSAKNRLQERKVFYRT